MGLRVVVSVLFNRSPRCRRRNDMRESVTLGRSLGLRVNCVSYKCRAWPALETVHGVLQSPNLETCARIPFEQDNASGSPTRENLEMASGVLPLQPKGCFGKVKMVF